MRRSRRPPLAARDQLLQVAARHACDARCRGDVAGAPLEQACDEGALDQGDRRLALRVQLCVAVRRESIATGRRGALQVLWKKFRPELGAIAQERDPLDQMLQLANVAGIIMTEQDRSRGSRELLSGSEALQELIDEQ